MCANNGSSLSGEELSAVIDKLDEISVEAQALSDKIDLLNKELGGWGYIRDYVDSFIKEFGD